MKLSLLGGNLVSPYFIILIYFHKPMLFGHPLRLSVDSSLEQARHTACHDQAMQIEREP